VLGLEVVLGDGVRTKCGGRVVKNVTGYDLMKLHVGALGTLGVIESAWIRLGPAPERVEVLVAAVGRAGAALERGIEAARLPSARAVALVGPHLADEVAPSTHGASGYLLVVELAGDAAPVEWDRRTLAERVSADPAPSQMLERIRSLQGRMPGDGGLRFRLAARPSCLSAVLEALERGGASVLAYPGAGVLYGGFALRDPAGEAVPEEAWRCVAAAARQASGGFVLEAAPHPAKEGRDVFGEGPANLALLRALKQRFDPDGVLNPGRYVGGL
jgi:glycolate oxidase FAD binding subunit